MPLIALAFAATLATRGARPEPPCPGAATPAVERCLQDRLSGAEAELARYVAAADARLRQQVGRDPAAARARQRFEAAEQAFAAYRDAECGAVFEAWSGGTIRNAMEIVCRLRITRLHTHTLWREWLTYMDSTPPILPEPAVPPGA
jgi:hypothetical protein